MPDEKRGRLEEVADATAEAATAGGLAAGGALAVGASPGAAATMGALAMLPTIVGKLSAAVTRWRLDRHERWLTAVITGDGDDLAAERLGRTLEEQADEPWVKRVVIESIRRVDESLDDAIIPSLGRLAREYLNEHLPPDGFFRGLSRMLSDLSGEEFRALQSLIRDIAQTPVPFDIVQVIWETNRQGSKWVVPPRIQALNENGRHINFWLEPISHMDRLSIVLKAHGLACHDPAGNGDHPLSLFFSRSQAKRIRSIIQGVDVSPPIGRAAEDGPPK